MKATAARAANAVADAASAVADVVRAGVGKFIPTEAARVWAQYLAKPDADLLPVYADALEQAGDPRGRFIQLSLAGAAQKGARDAMEKKLKGALVGPAKAFLREWEFGPNGLVDRARTEFGKLPEGADAIGQLSPRLMLTVTSVKTLKDAEAFGKLSPAALGKIWLIDFGMITGSLGGMQINDKQMAAMAPALAGVRRLQLSIAGAAGKALGPGGLRTLGAHAKQLEFLSINYYQGEGLPPAAAYARVLAEAFPSLKAIMFAEIKTSDLAPLKVKLNTIDMDDCTPRYALADMIEKATA